ICPKKPANTNMQSRQRSWPNAFGRSVSSHAKWNSSSALRAEDSGTPSSGVCNQDLGKNEAASLARPAVICCLLVTIYYGSDLQVMERRCSPVLVRKKS